MRDVLIKALAGRAERVLDLQTGLTAFRAYGPDYDGPGEWDKAAWLEERLRAFGIKDLEHIDAPDVRVPSGKRPNLVARVPGKTGRMLWVMAHLDVVPPGDMSLWRTDPWTVTRDPHDPDIIRGRGVEDNQQAAVAGILVAAELVEQGMTPDLGLGLLFVADEETGNEYGAIHVLAQRPDLISKDDLVLVPDFGLEDGTLIEVAEKGSFWLKVTVTGKQCHASTPDEGVNALVAASAMIMRISELEKRFSEQDPLFAPPRTTMVPTRHDANVPNANTLPGKDVFWVDCRVLPLHGNASVIQAFRELGADIAGQYGVTVEVEVDREDPVYPATPTDSDVVVKLTEAVRRIYGISCHPGGVGGGTVAKHMRRLGIPAAVWARVIPNYHAPNEGSRLSYTLGDAQVYAHLLFRAD